MLGILAGTDLKYICSDMYKAGFLVFIHLELFARGVQENWIIWEMACILPRPLVSGSHLFVLLPEEYRFAYFLEMTPGMFPVFSTTLGSTADTCSASVQSLFWKKFTLSYVKGGLSDPEVDPRCRSSKFGFWP